MPGEKFRISPTPDAKLFCVTTPRTIPFTYRSKLKQDIDLLIDQGNRRDTKEGHGSYSYVCGPLKTKQVCPTRTLFLCNTTRCCGRHPQSSAKYFTVFDALKGYHQCPQDEESQKLTTFITPFGRYMYLWAPYGISFISDHYNRRMDEVLGTHQHP